MKKHLVIALLATLVLPALSAQTADEIMQRTVDAQKASSSAMDIQMDLVSPNGQTATRRIQTLTLDTNGLTSTITVFLEPASVANTRFLTVENANRADDQWIYLPTLRKVRRIAATERSGSFMGSDFSYADMSSFTGVTVADNTNTLLREETLDGRKCWVIESAPKPSVDDEYSRRVVWVDEQTYVPLRVEYYGSGDTPEKVLTSSDLKQVQGRWTAGTITMTTTATGHKTVLTIRQAAYDVTLDSGYFTTTFLETGRTR